jgi:hypothetical protein
MEKNISGHLGSCRDTTSKKIISKVNVLVEIQKRPLCLIWHILHYWFNYFSILYDKEEEKEVEKLPRTGELRDQA